MGAPSSSSRIPLTIQARDAASPVLKASRAIYPFIAKLFADSADASERVETATPITVEIADQIGLVVLPRRWVVERFFAWINRNRHLAKDVEATIDSARASTPPPSCSSSDASHGRHDVSDGLVTGF